ncbi:hypothetical protein [Ruegeria jejuensis]|uniref:hypothetical protein n=1 Tax=Ruegeria jejuensis TaxID=3233338 RepID=UPI00355C8F02
MSSKLAQAVYDGGGKMKGRIEYIIEAFERAFDEEDQLHKSVDIDYVNRKLREIDDSMWWHEKTAVFFVVVWSFIIPTLLVFIAILAVMYG